MVLGVSCNFFLIAPLFEGVYGSVCGYVAGSCCFAEDPSPISRQNCAPSRCVILYQPEQSIIVTEGCAMKTPSDWQQILTECKTNIQYSIKPLLATIREPQPNLGMGAGGDMMKPVDLAAETAIVETLKRHNVSFTLISEESGIKKFGTFTTRMLRHRGPH